MRTTHPPQRESVAASEEARTDIIIASRLLGSILPAHGAHRLPVGRASGTRPYGINLTKRRPYNRAVTEWLSVWNAETYARNADLDGGQAGGIHVPHGKGLVAVGDLIYCTCVENEELLFITRLSVASVKDDPDDEKSVLVEDADGHLVGDVPREIPLDAAQAIEFEPLAGEGKRLPIFQVRINASELRGRASLRALAGGADELDRFLGGFF